MKTYSIRDNNSLLSKQYAEISEHSFKEIDFLEIEPLQCITPETLTFFDWDESKRRSLTEKAILQTYEKLFERLSEGEKFLMLEHDAFLKERETFLDLWEYIDQVDVWNVGAAAECWTVSKRVAQNVLKHFKKDTGGRGPLSKISSACKELEDLLIIFPSVGTGKTVFANSFAETNPNIERVLVDGEIIEKIQHPKKRWIHSPVTQICDEREGTTNVRMKSVTENWYDVKSTPPSPKLNPQWKWISLSKELERIHYVD